MKTALIVNPVSGKGKSLDILPDVIKWSRQRHVDLQLYTTTQSGEGTRMARLARLDGCERIAVLGGDGTLNEAAQALLDSDCVMGVIPGGSGNDFFKMINENSHVSKKALLSSALETAFLGTPLIIDVGLINDRPFINTVGIGFDADVARYVARSKYLSGFFAYLVGVFQVWRQFKAIPLAIQLDRHFIDTDVTLVSVGNGQSSGGGFRLTPQAKLDDGLLDACIIESLPKFKMLQHLPKTLKGTHTRLPFVKMFRSQKIVIKSQVPFNIHIDGEILQDTLTEIEIKLHPKRLKVAHRFRGGPQNHKSPSDSTAVDGIDN